MATTRAQAAGIDGRFDRTALQRAPHVVFEPALMIFFTVLALNMLGDAVRSRFDVREGGL